jgi:hypothetical protein
MTKAQVERIMGPPTSTETKDMIIFKRTTYRYEEGGKFALFTRTTSSTAKKAISPLDAKKTFATTAMEFVDSIYP